MASCSVDSGGPTDFPHKKKKKHARPRPKLTPAREKHGKTT